MDISHFNDQQLTAFIDQMFSYYDRNSDGFIQAPQFALFFNDLYASLGMQVQITLPIAQAAIRQIDVNGDGKLSRAQLFVAFKCLIVSNQNQQNYAIMKNYPPQYTDQAYQ